MVETTLDFIEIWLNEDFEHQRNPLLRSLAQKKSELSKLEDIIEEEKEELIQIVYGTLIERYGEEIHVSYITKERSSDYMRENTSEDLRYIYLGATNFDIPKEVLMHISRKHTTSLFYGLGKFLHEDGHPRYYFIPRAHSSDYSTVDILNHFIEIWNENNDELELIGERKRYPRRSVNNPLHNREILYQHISTYKRRDWKLKDIVDFLEANQQKLYCGPETARNSHTRVQKKLMKELQQEGHKTYGEVWIKTNQRTLTEVDVISLRNGNMTLYDCKGTSGLNTNFYRSEDNLREAARFFFYNFGYLPELKIKKRFPAKPINIARPEVNLRFAGYFN